MLLFAATQAAATQADEATPAPARAKAANPLQFDVGVMGGFTSFASNSGLGNAAKAEDRPGNGPLVGLHAGVVLLDRHLAVEASFRDTFTQLVSKASSAQVMGWRVRGLWYFLNDGPILPYVQAGAGQDVLINGKAQCKSATSSNCVWVKTPDVDKALEVGVGVKIPITYRLGLRLAGLYLLGDARPGSSGLASEFEAQAGVSWSFGGKPEDSDKDGMANDVDKCPNQAEDVDGFQDQDGCPELDNDGDGIADTHDKCPNEAEDLDKFHDDDGCPDPDNDSDGVPDAKDKCPDKPETKNGWQDDDGCPDVADSDGDGIANNLDKCPNQAEDKDGFQDDDGCPDADNDGDGLLDGADKCPNKPETKNGFQDEDGCPDQLAENVQKLFAAPLAHVQFKGDKLNRGADAALTPLLEFMLEQESAKVEIAVQPEGEGEPAVALALARAESIKTWVVAQGIDAGRLKTATTPPASSPAKPGKGGVVTAHVVLKLL
ncbi:MAG: thrombospondin type 3 repeat-containing protein [Deltaproteobacteria bacterium]|nr:thrombospondin type 3 repeat-containing protein [Deltaproteobacteria bacterium]